VARAPSQTEPGLSWRAGGGPARDQQRRLAEEVAIGISYDSEPYAVLMATPADVADLALGFTITERLAGAVDVLDIRVAEHDEGLVADVLLSAAGRLSAQSRRRRNLEGRTSCGLCGVESPEHAVRALPPVSSELRVRHEAVQRALGELESRQVLGRETRAAHAAAWADPQGRLLLLREDVGRHNALDKLIGAALRDGLDPASAMILVTSRASFEMVEKTVIAGVPVLAAISAPTALAVRKARDADLTLIGLARPDGHVVFTAERRLAPT
jgi:FdhD protein